MARSVLSTTPLTWPIIVMAGMGLQRQELESQIKIKMVLRIKISAVAIKILALQLLPLLALMSPSTILMKVGLLTPFLPLLIQPLTALERLLPALFLI